MNTKATIITTYYEGKQYLVNLFHMVYQNSENLKSLGYSVEFVIVNDSPWEKIEIPSQYSDMEVVVSYNPQNLGIHKSRVNGINLAHGDYILLLDQDDSITDDYLKEQLNAIESADISVCNGYKELEQKKKIIYRDRIKFSLVKNPEIYLKAANQIVSPGQCLIKKSSIPTEWLLCIVAYVAFSFTQANRTLYLVLVLNLFSVIANISWFFQGMEEFGKIVLRNIIFKVVNIIYKI